MKSAFTLKDRKLGDEWKDWKGDLESEQISAASGKRLFLGLILIWILFLGLSGALLFYLVTPRLALLHGALPLVSGTLLLIVWAFIGLWFFFMILALILKKHLFFKFRNTEICLTALLPHLQKLGQKIGFHPDKTGHSFVRVSNALMDLAARKIHPQELLVLLPRCLNPKLCETIKTTAKAIDFHVLTVAGGELARNKIRELKPKAVIGVACERDLVSGIRDIMPQIPVLGIPNIRPEGPCKNTRISINELEEAIETFLGYPVSFNLPDQQT